MGLDGIELQFCNKKFPNNQDQTITYLPPRINLGAVCNTEQETLGVPYKVAPF
jgi:hypothetical protein